MNHLTDVQRQIIQALTSTWGLYPSLRFGQLMSNILGPKDPFFRTDEDILEDIRLYPRR